MKSARYVLLFSLICMIGLWILAYSEDVIFGLANPLVAAILFIIGMAAFIWSFYLENNK